MTKLEAQGILDEIESIDVVLSAGYRSPESFIGETLELLRKIVEHEQEDTNG